MSPSLDRSQRAAKMLIASHCESLITSNSRVIVDRLITIKDRFDQVIVCTWPIDGVTPAQILTKLIDVTNTLEAAGKKVIPLLTFGSKEAYGIRGYFKDLTDPETYQNEWSVITDWVEANLARFDRVMVGNSGMEMGTIRVRMDWHHAYAHSDTAVQEVMDQINAVVAELPWLIPKLLIMPHDIFIDREALFVANFPGHVPLLKPFVESTNTILMMTTGACSIYSDVTQYQNEYYYLHPAAKYSASDYPSVPGFRPDWQVSFPLTHLRQYVRNLTSPIYSGVGWKSGAKSGNLSKLIALGWDGVFCMFDPRYEDDLLTETRK